MYPLTGAIFFSFSEAGEKYGVPMVYPTGNTTYYTTPGIFNPVYSLTGQESIETVYKCVRSSESLRTKDDRNLMRLLVNK